jgi:hypothetical protein
VSQIVREFDDKEDEIGLIRVKNHPSFDILEVWLTYWDKLLDIIVALGVPDLKLGGRGTSMTGLFIDRIPSQQSDHD